MGRLCLRDTVAACVALDILLQVCLSPPVERDGGLLGCSAVVKRPTSSVHHCRCWPSSCSCDITVETFYTVAGKCVAEEH